MDSRGEGLASDWGSSRLPPSPPSGYTPVLEKMKSEEKKNSSLKVFNEIRGTKCLVKSKVPLFEVVLGHFVQAGHISGPSACFHFEWSVIQTNKHATFDQIHLPGHFQFPIPTWLYEPQVNSGECLISKISKASGFIIIPITDKKLHGFTCSIIGSQENATTEAAVLEVILIGQ